MDWGRCWVLLFSAAQAAQSRNVSFPIVLLAHGRPAVLRETLRNLLSADGIRPEDVAACRPALGCALQAVLLRNLTKQEKSWEKCGSSERRPFRCRKGGNHNATGRISEIEGKGTNQVAADRQHEPQSGASGWFA